MPYLSLHERRMAYSQAEKSVKSDNGFFKLAILLEDSSKTIRFFQDSGLIPNDSNKDCISCEVQRSVALHKRSNQIIPYILRCSK